MGGRYLLVPTGLQAALPRQIMEGGAIQQRPILQGIPLRQLLCAGTPVQVADNRAAKPVRCAQTAAHTYGAVKNNHTSLIIKRP